MDILYIVYSRHIAYKFLKTFQIQRCADCNEKENSKKKELKCRQTALLWNDEGKYCKIAIENGCKTIHYSVFTHFCTVGISKILWNPIKTHYRSSKNPLTFLASRMKWKKKEKMRHECDLCFQKFIQHIMYIHSTNYTNIMRWELTHFCFIDDNALFFFQPNVSVTIQSATPKFGFVKLGKFIFQYEQAISEKLE